MIFSNNQKIGKYTIIKPLGEGYFAETYLVFDNHLMRQAVLKLFFEGNLNDLLKEARIQTQLSHTHIIKVHSADLIQNVQILASSLPELLQKHPNLDQLPVVQNARQKNSDFSLNVLCIDMEFMNNCSLGKKLKDQYIPIKDTINYMIKILSAIEYIHNQDFIHKDIKPDNILLNDSDTPKLADFGLSDHINSVKKNGYTTHLPPEYFKGILPNISSDIYACGMTLYRLANNYSEWIAELNNKKINTDDILKGKLIEKIGFQPFVPEKLKNIIKKATNKDSEKRYQSASEFRNALARICPKVSWYPVSQYEWICENGKNKDEIYIQFQPRKKVYNVCMKRNGRNLNQNTKTFVSEQEAFDAMFSYIRESYK